MKKIVKIKDKKIGGDNPTYVIAEIGSNHNQDINLAKKLIDKAADAKVDAVKFQTFKAEKLYSKKTPKFSKDGVKPFDLIKSIEMPTDWHEILKNYAEKKGLHFFSTPFDKDSVDVLDSIDVPAFKIASFELVDLELLKHTAKKGKPIILSTGLANIEEISEALSAIRSQGNDDIILLHCNSMYPAPPEIVNLNAIKTMSEEFQVPIGFSDHTLGYHIPVSAVAMGAKVIEKHYTLDRNLPGPDHSFAIQSEELKQMIKQIREIEKALGTGEKKPSEMEEEMLTKGRRSIIARINIKKDTKITKDMLIIKRPGFGIKPKYIDDVIGKTTKKDIDEDSWITWDDLN